MNLFIFKWKIVIFHSNRKNCNKTTLRFWNGQTYWSLNLYVLCPLKKFQLITFYANNPTIKIRMAKLSKAIRKQNFNNHHHQLIIKWLSTTKGWSNLKIFVSRKIYINSVKCCRTAPQNREPLVRKRGKSGLRSWMYNTQKKNPGARFFPGKHL